MRLLDSLHAYTIVWIITLYSRTVTVNSQRRADIDIPDLPTYATYPQYYTTTSIPAPTKPKSTIPDDVKVITITSPSEGKTAGPDVVPDIDNNDKTTATSKNRKEVTSKYDETPEVGTEISDREKSVDNTETEGININYVIAGTVAGVVALIGVIATTLGVLASKGFFTPKGFSPVETAV